MNEKINNVINHLEKATIEEIDEILNNYLSSTQLVNGQVSLKPCVIDGLTCQGFYNPQVAYTLNARYKELTGSDHPIYLTEQNKVIDLLLAHQNELLKAGFPDSYFANLKKLKTGIAVLNDYNHPFFNISDYLNHLNRATIEELDAILSYYKGTTNLADGYVDLEPILVNGVMHHGKYNPFIAATLNERYKELTGHDHPTFIVEQRQVLNFLLQNKDKLPPLADFQIGLEQLKQHLDNPTFTINTTKQPKDLFDVMKDLDHTSIEDIDNLLNNFNKIIVLNGHMHHSFNDPLVGEKLNNRYYELTGHNHSFFVAAVKPVIANLLRDKDLLIAQGGFSPNYFAHLESLLESLSNENEPHRAH